MTKTYTIENDPEWKDVHDQIDTDSSREGMTDVDAYVAWELGLAAWKAAKHYGARFAHEGAE